MTAQRRRRRRLRRTLGVVAAAAAALWLVALAAGPAEAHGSLRDPVSRAAACGPEGGRDARSRACLAAAASGARLDDWDTIRVPGVAGRDRELIPDGELCSGGLDRFAGLDAARADWPATTLRAGAEFTFTYRATIPHQGTFRLYVTTDGYAPTQPLTWSDLEPEPFLTATDPPLRDGSYRIEGRLPRGKSGRHLIYAVWRNSDTPDTYYSCSDVVFGGGGAGGGGAARPEASRAAPGAPGDAPRPEAGTEAFSSTATVGPAGGALPLLVVAGLAVLLIVAGGLVLRRR